ncbi:hypothetical protein VTN00DRAFT_4599 [Thermoascus crustaceus]|uniref:uncharacterized protein n=1 Tax=Thermoascus crustaceus TaxID=5088 RepID=UPI00374232DF
MAPIPSEEEWLAATAKARKEAEEAAARESRESRPPLHPVPQLQGPFEESIVEASNSAQNDDLVDRDAQSQRRHLLESKEYERICGRKWRQKPGERYHPLWKLISQMSFGMHLLAKGLAKSESEVMKILQSHVDELDGFIERTTDDFLLAHSDIQQRVQYLRLPLENIKVFDEMLEDRSFRNSVIDDNEKIEHVIERSATALNDALKDILKGIDAINVLWSYLKQLAKEWTPGPGSFDAVYAAMIGNVEGWHGAFVRLQIRGNDLAVVLVQLGAAVSEIQRRVGVASRKDVNSLVSNPSIRPRAKSLKEKFFEKTSVAAQNDKPLPSDPGPFDPAIEQVLSKRIPAQRIARQSVPNLKGVELSDVRPVTVPRRTRSFNDATNRAGENRSLPKIPENTVAGVKRKLPKTAAWTKSHPGDKPASRPATAPSRPLQARSNSLEQLETSATEGKSSFRTVLDSLVQSEKKKSSLAPAAREKTRDQLLHHFKSKRALDIVSSANKERKPSRRTLATKRDWPFSIFRAKSSNDLSRSVESSDFKNFGADPSSLSGPTCEHEMTWSDIPNTHTLKPNPGGSPRLPTFTLCTPVKESFEEEKAAYQEEEAESELTALPPLGPSAILPFESMKIF